LLAVTFYRSTDGQSFTTIKEFLNKTLVEKQKLDADILTRINTMRPVSLHGIDKTQGADLLNRSITYKSDRGDIKVPILTFVLPANFMNDDSKELFIVVDFMQTFLMRTLGQSELTEVFLMFANGRILSHPDETTT